MGSFARAAAKAASGGSTGSPTVSATFTVASSGTQTSAQTSMLTNAFKRHRVARLRILWRDDVHQQPGLALVAVIHDRTDGLGLRIGPLDRARVPAGRQASSGFPSARQPRPRSANRCASPGGSSVRVRRSPCRQGRRHRARRSGAHEPLARSRSARHRAMPPGSARSANRMRFMAPAIASQPLCRQSAGMKATQPVTRP